MPHSICSKDNLPENYQTCIIKWKTETARHTIPTRPILIKNTAIRGRIFHIWTFNSSIMNIKQRLNRVKEWTIYNLIKAKNICFSAINHRKKCCDTRFIKKLFMQKPSPAFRLLPSPLKTNLSTIITGNNPWEPPAHFNINPQNISSSMTFRASSQTGLLSQAFDYLSI